MRTVGSRLPPWFAAHAYRWWLTEALFCRAWVQVVGEVMLPFALSPLPWGQPAQAGLLTGSQERPLEVNQARA